MMSRRVAMVRKSTGRKRRRVSRSRHAPLSFPPGPDACPLSSTVRVALYCTGHRGGAPCPSKAAAFGPSKEDPMFFDSSRKHAVGALGVESVDLPSPARSAPIRADPLVVTRWTVDGGGAGSRRERLAFVTAGTIGQLDAGLLAGVGLCRRRWIPGSPASRRPSPSMTAAHRPGAETYTLAIHPASPNPMQSRTHDPVRGCLTRREALVQAFDLRGALQRTVASETVACSRCAPVRLGRAVAPTGIASAPACTSCCLRLGPLERSQKLVVVRCEPGWQATGYPRRSTIHE